MKKQMDLMYQEAIQIPKIPTVSITASLITTQQINTILLAFLVVKYSNPLFNAVYIFIFTMDIKTELCRDLVFWELWNKGNWLLKHKY
jgi:hypothetical protein